MNEHRNLRHKRARFVDSSNPDLLMVGKSLELKLEKRSKIVIYFDILEALCERVDGEVVCPTRISHKTNLPYDRFRSYLEELVHIGLVSRQGRDLVVTEKGLEYVEWHRSTTSFLKRMGLLP
jgi:predicted transcriptional regulator